MPRWSRLEDHLILEAPQSFPGLPISSVKTGESPALSAARFLKQLHPRFPPSFAHAAVLAVAEREGVDVLIKHGLRLNDTQPTKTALGEPTRGGSVAGASPRAGVPDGVGSHGHSP